MAVGDLAFYYTLYLWPWPYLNPNPNSNSNPDPKPNPNSVGLATFFDFRLENGKITLMFKEH